MYSTICPGFCHSGHMEAVHRLREGSADTNLDWKEKKKSLSLKIDFGVWFGAWISVEFISQIKPKLFTLLDSFILYNKL